MKKVRWLLVGAGDISRKRVAPALANAPESEIAAVCDVHENNLHTLAETYAVRERFTDYAEALQKASADAVYLATPVYLHTRQAEQALAAGKHILVEKPISLSGSEGYRLVKAHEQSGKVGGCAYYRRFFPAYQTTLEMVKAGAFGQVILVRMLYYAWFGLSQDDPKYWRVQKDKSGGGPLFDIGSHMFDLLIGLFGLPDRVVAYNDNLVHKDWDVEDTASILMTLHNGAQVTASFSWSSKTWRHEFEIVGTEMKINWLPFDSGEVVRTKGREVDTLNLPPADNVHLPLIQDFVSAVLEQRQPVCSLHEGLKTNILLDAIYQSAHEGREICLPDGENEW